MRRAQQCVLLERHDQVFADVTRLRSYYVTVTLDSFEQTLEFSSQIRKT